MSTLGRGQLLHLRLFIENVEVPVIGAMISASEGAPAAAQVEVIPTDSALRLRPRSKIKLFYLDYDAIFIDGSEELVTEHQLRADQSRGIDDESYKLLFSGELFTMMFTKSGPGSRSLVLQCLDDSNVWDTSFLYLLRYSDGGQENAIAANQSKFLGLSDNANQFDDILNKPEVIIRQIAARQRARSPSLQGATGLIAGLYGVLELLGGVEGKYVGVTAWHTIQEAQNRVMDQIAGDSGETAAALFDQSAFENWITNRIGDAGSVISFRQLIQLVNSYIYYSVFPNPVGVYRPGSRSVPSWPESLGSAVGGGLNEDFGVIVEEVIAELQARGWDGDTKPLAVMTSGYRTLEDRNRIERALRRELSTNKPRMAHDWGFAADVAVGVSPRLGLIAGRKPADSVEEAEGLHQKALTVIELEGIATFDQLRASGHFTDAELDAMQLLADFFIEFGEVAVSKGMNWGGNWSHSDGLWDLFGMGWDPVHMQLPNWQQEVGEDVLAAGVATSVELDEFYASLPERERLYTQFFRPDVWFAPPPACNVIFPEETVSFTYTRQMMRETTRLQLTTFNALYEDLLLNQVYFAPGFDQVESLAAGGIGSAAKAVVYPHEKYSGIIPKMERISEVAFYSRMSEDNRLDATTTLPEDDGSGVTSDADNQLDLWAARTAAFNFLSHRYAARSAVATTRFAPRLVCGWPGLFIDRVAPPNTTEAERSINPSSPTHFLGMIKTLSHSVTQAGGQTSVTMSHARSHKTGDETDDLFAQDIFEKKGLLSVQVDKATEVTTEISIKEGMSDDEFSFCVMLSNHLLEGGSVDPVPDVWTSGRLSAVLGLEAGEYVAAHGPKGGELVSIEVIEDTADQVPAGDDADDPFATRKVGESARTGRSVIFQFSRVTVVEKPLENAGLLPIEEAIRPPWISNEYSNEEIGSLYDELLGCPSIMDLYTVAPAEGYSVASVAQAVERLVTEYTAVSGSGHSADEFIRAKTTRGFASLTQVIGTSGDPGFYYYSSGPYENLEGEFYEWMTNETAVTQVNPEEPQKISGELDPRKGRYERALAYQQELLQFHGLRG